MTSNVTIKCHECKEEFQTETVSLMGQMFFAERYCPECLIKEIGTDALPLTEGRSTMQMTRTIKEVTKRNIEPKSGRAPFTLFEIEDDTGTKWTTKKQDLALEAHSFVGKLATIDGTIKQNGEYKNYYLEGITEAGQTDAFTQTNGNSEATFETVRDTTGSKDEMIWRQTACKVSAVLSDDPVTFWENTDRLMHYFRTGEHPGQQEGEYATAAAFTANDDTDDLPF